MLRASLFLCAAALAATPALAEPRRDLMMTRVAVGDLDLASDAGARVMLHRLKRASRELCEQPRSKALPRAEAYEWKCQRRAMDAAVEQLRAPKLTLAYAAWLTTEPTAGSPSPRLR